MTEHVDDIAPGGQGPDVDLRGDAPAPGWSTGRRPGGGWWAEGPCSTCFGAAYGPPLPQGGDDLEAAGDAQQGEGDRAPAAAFVHVTCHCGHEHGDLPDSCGRSFQVLL